LTIAVLASAQGQGVARLLLEHMAQRARALQLESILLEVRMSNQRALSVYEAFGFIAVGRRKGYYQISPHEREDALILRYILDRSAK
jgi:ribosomal-protein-alanine N-acetyltransferase